MIVSWNWLKDYVALDVGDEEFTRRLMMAGLNHESTDRVGEDLAIDLEVTSNRPDCLGHLGVAREAAVLFQSPLKIPAARPKTGKAKVHDLAQVAVECPALCFRYTARVIRDVKVGPSPDWLVRRLATLGVSAINNVVDITNYVLFECGQPLHAFDLARLRDRRIVVREPRPGERLEAINHKTYELKPGMCVIADGQRPVAIGGVMGGADTEVSQRTAELLIEAAEFDPLAVRTAARQLALKSDSSYRFERGVDPEGVDWASRRCCELILDLAGGELAEGVIDVGAPCPAPAAITLRLGQIPRVLGIKVDLDESARILTALGCRETSRQADRVEVVPPSWRRDLAREIDLIEEVARVHGYEAIPEDASVPMAASHRTDRDRVLVRIRQVLTACGLFEAMTLSVVDTRLSEAFSPWTKAPPLVTSLPILRGADLLRRSLVPSLLASRATNEAVGNADANLFEIANVYLPRAGELPAEESLLAFAISGDFFTAKGILETLLRELRIETCLEVRAFQDPLVAHGAAAELKLGQATWGYGGEVAAAGLKQFDLRHAVTVAEVRTGPLVDLANLIPHYRELPGLPSISRDVNLVLPRGTAWSAIEKVVGKAGGELLEAIRFVDDSFRDESRVGQGNKSVVFSLDFRGREATLTNQEVDALRDKIVAACRAEFGAELRH